MTYGAKPVKTREMYQRDLNMSRMNLLLSVIFTVVNLVMIMMSISTSFLFSASIPYYMSLYFAINCGMFDEAFYEAAQVEGETIEWQFLDPSIFWGVFAVSVVIVLGLLALWFFSKKNKVCSVLTVIIYAFDMLFLIAFSVFIGNFGIDFIFQLLFHAWILYYAFLAVKAWNGIETAPTAQEVAARMGYGASPYGASPYGANPYGASPYGRSYCDDDDEGDEGDVVDGTDEADGAPITEESEDFEDADEADTEPTDGEMTNDPEGIE